MRFSPPLGGLGGKFKKLSYDLLSEFQFLILTLRLILQNQ